METQQSPGLNDQTTSNQTQWSWFLKVGFLISALLLTSFAASLILAGKFFFPSWNGLYLLPVAFISAIDGIFAYRKLRSTRFPEKDWVFYRFSEWVVILLLLKLGFYFSNGVQSLATDLNSLAVRDWASLLSGEFLLSVLVMLFIWMLSSRFAELLGQLEVNEVLLKVEQESGIYELRSQARESLVSMVLVLGVIMVLITSLAGMQTQVDWRENPAMRMGVANLLAFFFLTLCLFSLSQLNLMSTIWLREGLAIRSDLVRSWLVNSAFVILLLAIISAILPTRYSIGLLSILNYLAKTLLAILSYLVFVISAPFFMVVAFLASLFRLSAVESMDRPEPVLDLPPPPVDTAPVPWLEMLKSILFWLVLAGMLIFALTYYLHENKALWVGLKRLALFRRLQYFWQWLRGGWRRVNHAVQDRLQQGWQILLSRLQGADQAQIPSNLHLRRLSDREKVFFYYLAMLRRSAEKGSARKPWQTPYEYLRELENSLLASNLTQVELEVEEGVETGLNAGSISLEKSNSASEWLSDSRDLTEYFMKARYSPQPVTHQEAGLVKQIWERLRKVLRKR